MIEEVAPGDFQRDWAAVSPPIAPVAALEPHSAEPPTDVPDEDVSAGLRIPPGIDMSTTSVDPASVDLAWFDRYTTGEVPAQDGAQEPARRPSPDEDR